MERELEEDPIYGTWNFETSLPNEEVFIEERDDLGYLVIGSNLKLVGYNNKGTSTECEKEESDLPYVKTDKNVCSFVYDGKGFTINLRGNFIDVNILRQTKMLLQQLTSDNNFNLTKNRKPFIGLFL